MRKIVTAASLFVVALLVASGAHAQDVTGTWSLEMSAFLPEVQTPCTYQGNVTLSQDGSQVSAPVTLALTSGPQACPAELSGTLDGVLSPGDGTTNIDGTISGSDPGGLASFSGTIDPPAAPVSAASMIPLPFAPQDGGGDGDFFTEEGPFSGTSGTWNAVFLQAVPAVSPVALTVLVLLLLAAGALALRRQGILSQRS